MCHRLDIYSRPRQSHTAANSIGGGGLPAGLWQPGRPDRGHLPTSLSVARRPWRVRTGQPAHVNGSRFKVAHRINAGGTSGNAQSQPLPVVEIADSGLDHISHISDEEGNRFQMPVLIIGQLLPQHRGGTLLGVGGRPVEHLRGQALRLRGVGPADLCTRQEPTMGYPTCTVCGAIRSPYASRGAAALGRSTGRPAAGSRARQATRPKPRTAS